MEKSYKELLKDITTFVFDIDGVLTEGKVLVSNDGELLRIMSVRDGFILKTAVELGYNIAIITGGVNLGAKQRLVNLGITDIYMGQAYKMNAFNQYLQSKNIDAKHVLYMGDDVPDIPPMKAAGMPTCPQDAIPEVKAVAKYISHIKGGNGCVRDVIEQVMKVQGKWQQIIDRKE